VHGDFLPRDIMGRFYIVCAMLRQLVITLWILKNERDTFDVLFIDQLSACIPILKWFTSAKVNEKRGYLKPKV
jgi:alpha-1,3/alpha-1,6-mannosyltransferase